jgi:TIR domain
MESIQDLMVQLDGADEATVKRIAWEKGSLPVRLAMLGLAAIRKGHSPLWYGYPPGVFISYKWAGEPMKELVLELARHLRDLGYRAFLDVENLDEDADAYFQIPQFITSLQDCTYYLLLLTALSADLMTARKGRTTWIHDEYQHAVRLVNQGRLVLIPVLLEPGGTTEFFSPDKVVDLTADQRDFRKLETILPPTPLELPESGIEELSRAVEQFDRVFLRQRWAEAGDVLLRHGHLGTAFDHQFRRMLHAIYTADQAALDVVLQQLHATYGEQIVFHLYSGYCNEHGIPNRASMPTS